MADQRRLSRRNFLAVAGGTAAVTLLAACSGPSAPATSGAPPAAAPAATTGARKTVLFWGRQQFLPDSNDYLTESVKLAGQKGGFDVNVQLFSNDEHPQKEVVAMESGVVPDITYTYAPALWNQNGYAMDVQALYDEIGKTGGGWLPLAEGASRTAAGKRIAVPMNNEPWFLHLRKDKFAEVGVTLPIKTWDEMMAAFAKVNKPADNFYAFDGQMTEADWGGNCLQFMWSFGGRLFDKEGTPTINTPQNIAGVKAYTDLFKNKMMPPGVVSQLAAGNNEAWLSGGTAAVSNPGSIVLAMRTDNKDLLANTYLQAFPAQAKPGTFVEAGGSAALVINQKSKVIDEAMQVARMILAPDRYPTQLEKAGSYWFPIMQNYLTLPFFTQDEWNKEVTENIVPWTLAGTADTGLTPIYDDITISATKDMLQAIVVNGKSVEEGVKILADAAAAAKAKFKM
ncbi:MAG TPA: ABC transporter substrate-binding protein [Chloroflexota bacterium]|nr:ABC transporter substrate-binding protein [Chloroflexota bacterium]